MEQKDLDQKDLKVLRHSAAHLTAHAILELYPDTLLTIGPATEEGFFYDILPAKNLKEEDLPKIEAKMHEISNQNLPIEHKQISKEEARKIFAHNPFKLELIEQIPGDTVGLSIQGNFRDLCKGGHVPSTKDIQHFKLTGLSGAYWKANRENQALERIHGTAFYTKEEMDEYEKKREELIKFDHRRLGKQLDLFSFHDEGVGFPFYHPKGKKIVNILVEYMRILHKENNYQEIGTPILLSDELWHRSGHYAYYKENMYFTCVDNQSYAVKPMNCPGSFIVFNTKPRSYRELPLKLAEFGLVHRHELSGALHGLFRVRAFTQDDAHIFCTLDQIEEEITVILKIVFQVTQKFNFQEVELNLSTKPAKAMGTDEMWEKAIKSLKNALNKFNIPYSIQEGEGAFYGPKIDIKIQDSMKRKWQCGTIQLDFFQPENFDLNYVTPQGTFERPVIIHQAIYGSIERFFGILLEHYKGDLPFWISPMQAKILTITDDQKEYAQKINLALLHAGIRSYLNETSDPINAKIKFAQNERIPWMIIIGKKEVENNTVSLRTLEGEQQNNIPLDELIEKAKKLNKF